MKRLQRLALLVPLLLSTNLFADPSTPGALLVQETGKEAVEMPLRHTKVEVSISAFLARVQVEQTFENPFDHPVEAVYTFPLGDRAAVDDFEFVIGERTIRGEIKRREEARQVYESARSQGMQAALLEQERPNVFTQSIANLEPHRAVRVRIRTVETLPYDAGRYRFVFPLVVGPRYVPGGGAVAEAERITPPVLPAGMRSGHDVEIHVDLACGVPIREIQSPSHALATEHRTPTACGLHLVESDRIPNKDFVLEWSVSSEKPAVGVLAHRDGLDGFFTLLVQPKGTVEVEEAMPKEIVLVLDTSGSMQGVPIEASKRFVRQALRTLGPRDTFNLIRFAGSAEHFAERSLPNDAASIEKALAWIDGLEANGGTEMLRGFRKAFQAPPDPDRLRMVIFLTDGYIGNESDILAEIGKVVGSARIYTLGIGSAVNQYLLDRMALLGGGANVTISTILPDKSALQAIERFRSWVTRPYLTDIEVDWGSLPVANLVPDKPRDLGSGQTLSIVGRYLDAAEGDVTVRGRLGGRYWEQKVHVVLPALEKDNDALASIWARHRIEELLLASPGSITQSTRAEVTALALQYRLMSVFTSFVAVDDAHVVNPGGQAETVHQALPLPEGVSFAGVFGADGPPFRKVQEVVPQPSARQAPIQAPSTPQVAEAMEGRGRKEKVDLEKNDTSTKFSDEFVQDLPASGQLYQNVLMLAPPEGAARSRDFKAVVAGVAGGDVLSGTFLNHVNADSIEEIEAITIGAAVEYGQAQGGFARIIQRQGEPLPSNLEHLRDAALRVLADLAEDGKLSPAEGRPALAALLGAQLASGEISDDAAVQALATWALGEAAAKTADLWVRKAAEKAQEYRALGSVRELLDKSAPPRSPAARLLAALPRGHLTLVR